MAKHQRGGKGDYTEKGPQPQSGCRDSGPDRPSGYMSGVLGWLSGNIKTIGIYAIVATILAMGVQIKYLQSQVENAQKEKQRIGLVADSLLAELDTTRLVADQFRRRAIQVEIEKDSLALALDERPVVETTVFLTAEPINETSEVVVAEEDSSSYARSSFENEVVIAAVEFRMAPLPRIATWEIQMKPIEAMVGVRCLPMSTSTGVRPVEVVVAAPPFDVQIGGSQIDPTVCNAPPPPAKVSAGFFGGLLSGVLTMVGVMLIS